MTRSRRTIAVVLAAAAILAVITPMLWVIRVAAKPPEEFVGAPHELGGSWTLDNLTTAWQTGGLGQAMANSLYVVTLGSLVTVTLAALAGWGLAKYAFAGRGVVGGLFVAALFLPLAALVMPLFEESLRFELTGSRTWLAVVYGTVFAPWATLFMRSFFLSVPNELIEAAAVDGAGAPRTFASVAVPMARPALATAFVLTFFLQWSELILGLILLPRTETQTVAVAIAQFSTQFRTGGPLTAAGMLIGATPVLLLFLVGQRWLRAGALSGALKS